MNIDWTEKVCYNFNIKLKKEGNIMISYIFGKAIDILKRKPFMLWGVSLLYMVVVYAVLITGSLVPILSIPIILTLSAGVSALYLDGYNGKEVNSKQLFRGFEKECIGRVPAGMLWYMLWGTIWAFVPVVGIIKSYSYAFTPYILLSRPEISVLDALKTSMEETSGYKARMFGADILMALILIGLYLVFALIMIIPVLGWIVGFIGMVATAILFPLFSGLVRAGFYEEAKTGRFKKPYYAYNQQVNATSQIENAANEEGIWFCTQCGVKNIAAANFCTQCGKPKNI